MIYTTTMLSPVGELGVAVNEEGAVVRISFGPLEVDEAEATEDFGRCSEVIRQLREYFAGSRRVFDLPIAPEGTDFQKRVWNALASIPYGTTASYRDLAERVGDVKAVRAVGRANGANPIPIVVPCHRVIGSSGSLVGFAGGMRAKEILLALEGSRSATLFG